MKPTVEVEGIVLSVQEYKENDGIVKLLSRDGILSILAKGIQKQSSKNRIITQPFSKVKLTMEKREGLSLLYYGQSITYYYRVVEDLISSGVCFVLSQCISYSQFTNSTYDLLERCLVCFQTGEQQAYTYACLILRELIVKEGIAPYLDGCVLCQRKDHLETISLNDGGLLCSSCNHGRMLTRSKVEMIQMISLFKVKIEDIGRLIEMYDYTLDDFIYWAMWFERYMHLSLSSLTFLKSIQSMS